MPRHKKHVYNACTNKYQKLATPLKTKRLCWTGFLSASLVMSALLVSCTGIMKGIYGVKKPISSFSELRTTIQNEEILSKYPNAYIDSNYMNYVSRTLRADSQKMNNAFQPMQALYFNQNKGLVSYHINCAIGGFPNLNWNKGNYFENYPPKTRVDVNAIQEYDSIVKFLHPVFPADSLSFSQPSSPVTFVFWNHMLFKQSKNLIKLVGENAKNQNVKVVLVNTDIMYGGEEIAEYKSAK